MTLAVAAARAAELLAAGEQNNPFVSSENLGLAATLGGTAVLTDGARINAVVGTTWDFWLPDVSGTEAVLEMQLASAVTCGFAGVVAHNIGTLGGTARWERSTDGGGIWTDAGAGTITPANDRPMGWRMVQSGNDADRWRLRVTGLTAGDPLAVGVAHLGQELVFPTRVYQGIRPPVDPARIDGDVNVSVGGHLLGSDATVTGGSFGFELEHLPDSFIRGASFRAFLRRWNLLKPAFVHWRPTKYPEDLIYAWRSGSPIEPDNAGPKAYMSIKLDMTYHAG